MDFKEHDDENVEFQRAHNDEIKTWKIEQNFK